MTPIVQIGATKIPPRARTSLATRRIIFNAPATKNASRERGNATENEIARMVQMKLIAPQCHAVNRATSGMYRYCVFGLSTAHTVRWYGIFSLVAEKLNREVRQVEHLPLY